MKILIKNFSPENKIVNIFIYIYIYIYIKLSIVLPTNIRIYEIGTGKLAG